MESIEGFFLAVLVIFADFLWVAFGLWILLGLLALLGVTWPMYVSHPWAVVFLMWATIKVFKLIF